MLLTLPAAPTSALSPAVARHGRTLAAAVVGVLLAHWLLLGQGLLWPLDWTYSSASRGENADGSDTPILQTRTIAPSVPTAAVLAPPVAPALPLAPEPTLRQVPRFTPLPEPPANAREEDTDSEDAPQDLASNLASSPVDTAQASPKNIANMEPSQPPSGPDGGKQGAVATSMLAAGTALASNAPLRLTYPEPARLKYEVRAEVKGISISLNGELLWQHDGKTYNSRLEFSHFLLGSRMQTSKGTLGPQGLEPIRFGDKVRSEVAAHFDRSANKVTFSANTPDVPLTPGMQDQLSAVLQLSAMMGGEPQRYPAGTQIPFEAIGPRSVESWTMVVGNTEKLTLPGGEVSAIKLSRGAVGPYGNRAEIWLAPSMGYLPVRIRLTEANGDVADKLWRSTQAP